MAQSGNRRAGTDPYFIEAAARVLDVLSLFGENDQVRLTDVMTRLGMIKSTAFRFLYTLEKAGYIERAAGSRGYRRVRKHRIGFASISSAIPFVLDVERGIGIAAEKARLEVEIRHHDFDGSRLLADVEELLAAGVRLLVCYNPDEYVSHVVADRCTAANIPVIAITFPIPGARVFGVNNYRAGLAGGEGLAEEVVRRWSGHLDKVVVLDIPGSSPAQRARVTGMIAGLQTSLKVPADDILHVHTGRRDHPAQAAMHHVLASHPKLRRIAVLSYNDLNALGALEAVEQSGRTDDVAILSQGAVFEVREHLRKRRSALWCAVAHFPEKFGEKLIPLMLKVLRGEDVPATTYTDHVLLTSQNVRRYYAE